MTDHTFRCELCGGTFLDDSPENRREKEFRETFPDEEYTPENTASCCDECYNGQVLPLLEQLSGGRRVN